MDQAITVRAHQKGNLIQISTFQYSDCVHENLVLFIKVYCYTLGINPHALVGARQFTGEGGMVVFTSGYHSAVLGFWNGVDKHE